MLPCLIFPLALLACRRLGFTANLGRHEGLARNCGASLEHHTGRAAADLGQDSLDLGLALGNLIESYLLGEYQR